MSTPSAIADTSTRTRLHSWQHGFTTMYRFGAVPARICACSSAYSRSDAARSSACGVVAPLYGGIVTGRAGYGAQPLVAAGHFAVLTALATVLVPAPKGKAKAH